MNNDKNVIGVSVKRDEKEKISKYFKDSADYIASDDFEKKLDIGIDIAKGTVGVLGATATVLLLICPFDGPVGEIVSFLATPGLVFAVGKLGDELKKTYRTSKKIYSGSINTETGKVDVGKGISNATLDDVHQLKSSVRNIKMSKDELKNMFSDSKISSTSTNYASKQ